MLANWVHCIFFGGFAADKNPVGNLAIGSG